MITKNGTPILFCNIGWMERYEGQHKGGDTIHGGGKYVREKGMGHEICNFLKFRGSLFGYVQPRGEHISLERLGGSTGDDALQGVTVVWTAKRPGAGTCVVGWYQNATVYRNKQKHASKSPHHSEFGLDFYRIKARATDATLLPVDARTVEIPRQKKGGMGQANVWYAETKNSEETVRQVMRLIAGKSPASPKKTRYSKHQDPEKKAKVELAAVRVCQKHFEKRGFEIKSVERENLGWDLNAYKGKTTLHIEVKGLSGPNPSVELTPNEYRVFKESEESMEDRNGASRYRLAIVVEALTKPRLILCRYSREQGGWVDDKDLKVNLDITPRVAATIKID